jgi:transposase
MATAAAHERLVEVEADQTVVVDRRPVGEEKTFRPYDPDQVLLMAPVLSDWIPEGDLAHFVADLVETGTLDLSAIYDSFEEERGFPPYDPRLMVKLLVYGYANGTMSSRKLERATYRDVAVRMLCADQHPDIARSRGSASGIWRRWGSCSCRRCGCASARSWSSSGRWRWTGRSCVRTRRGIRR